jgi:protein-disulfide isomerase
MCANTDAKVQPLYAGSWRGNSTLIGCAVAGMLALLCLSPQLAAQTPGTSTSPVLAIVDGQPITEDQLPADEQAQLGRMMEQVYGVQMRALHTVLDQKLIQAESKRKGVTPDALFQSEVLAKVPEPTDAQIRADYESRPELKSHPYDEVRGKISDGLKGLAIQKQRALYVRELTQQAMNDGELTLLIAPPKVEITADPARLRGDSKAPITIVEFSDFSCPFCRKAEFAMTEILAKYPGKVNVGYRDFPLTELHPHAEAAAEASRCAGEQGKYWEYHDLLFANPTKQDDAGLMEQARSLKLNAEQFQTCFSSGRYKADVKKDSLLGQRGGIVATPGFFVNGVFVNGAQPPATFEKIIDQELAAPSPKKAGK